MRFPRSISWRLQLWHGLMLALVLAGFGATAWRYERTRILRGVDQELERRVAPVADALRRGPGQPRPERDANLFGGEPGRSFYYVAWSADGREVGRSASAPPEVPRPERADGPRAWRSRGHLREYVHFGPPGGECVLVGREVGEELAGIHRFAWLLGAAGGTVFGLGLLGGWWISRRALRPIAEISATAARISTGDLAQRIPTAEDGSELDDLARVLNDTFARLQGSFARQARFTADASHELRTPVSVVLTQTQSALARERPASEYRDALLACQRAAQRMRRLADSLLTLARLDSGQAPPPRSACDLDQVARDALELLRPLAEQQGVGLAGDLSPARCPGDPEQLGQVVANLVGNAIRHTPAGGRVVVRTASEPGQVVLSVADTGEGIAASDLPHVFDRFYRADPSRSSADGRVGLGLAIVKAVADGYGGTVHVASEPGRGSTFTVRLPASSGLAAAGKGP